MLLVAILSLGIGVPAAHGQTPPPLSVLILHPDLALLPAAVLADHGFRSRFGAIGVDAEFVTEHVDQDQSPDGGIRELFRRNIAARKFDLVYTIGITPLRFALENRAALFPGVPIVFSLITDAGRKDLALDHDVSGVVTTPDPAGTVRAAVRLQPQVRRVVVVGGGSTLDRIYVDDVRRELTQAATGLDVSYLTGLPIDSTRAHVATLSSDSIVLFVVLLKDGAGRAMTGPEGLRLLAPTAAVPIYGLSDTFLGHGIVGGRLVDFEADAARAADIALRRLTEGPAAATIDRSYGDFKFDALQLQRWGLRRADLPAGSAIVNLPPPLWWTYRWPIAGALTLIALQGVLIAGLLVQRARRQRAEEVAQRRAAALQHSHNQIRDLANRLMTAQEAERRRIARDLHDDFGQRLASLSIGLSNVKWDLSEVTPAVRERLTQLQDHAKALGKDLRQLSHELHPGMLDHVGLVEALRGRCDEVSVASGIAISVEAPADWTVTGDVAVSLYRVAQEALRNIEQHARAHHARIMLSRQPDSLLMRISDDGVGFDADGAAMSRGLGLLSMRERVEMAGGALDVRSTPARGTIVDVLVPLGEQR